MIAAAKPIGITSNFLRALALSALGLLGGYAIIFHSVAAYVAEHNPELALLLNSSEPVALLKLADAKIAIARRQEQVLPAMAVRRSLASYLIGQIPVPLPSGFEVANAIILTELPPSDITAGVHEGYARLGDHSQVDEELATYRSAWETRQAAQKEAEQLAKRALRAEPVSAHAITILAQVADGEADRTRAQRLFEIASRRSNRESEAIYWLMERAVEAGDYSSALRSADILLRSRPGLMSVIGPEIVRLAEMPAAEGAVMAVLAKDPSWRSAFLIDLPLWISDARTGVAMLARLKEATLPPGAAEWRTNIEFLFRSGYQELAYYAWLQFLTAEQLSRAALLFNGAFAWTPSGLPFDWVIESGAGVTAQVAPLPDGQGKSGLNIEFTTGPVQFGGVRQFLMLAPGTYILRGKYKGEVVGRRGLRWRLSCATHKLSPNAETPMVLGSFTSWKGFELQFRVPEEGCRAQQLKLIHDARSTSEQIVTGSVWFKELEIVRQ